MRGSVGSMAAPESQPALMRGAKLRTPRGLGLGEGELVPEAEERFQGHGGMEGSPSVGSPPSPPLRGLRGTTPTGEAPNTSPPLPSPGPSLGLCPHLLPPGRGGAPGPPIPSVAAVLTAHSISPTREVGPPSPVMAAMGTHHTPMSAVGPSVSHGSKDPTSARVVGPPIPRCGDRDPPKPQRVLWDPHSLTAVRITPTPASATGPPTLHGCSEEPPPHHPSGPCGPPKSPWLQRGPPTLHAQ